MKFFVMFLDHNGPVGVSALWADGSRWVRFYADVSKDYPRPVFYDGRRSALNHAKAVTGWLKRNDGDFYKRIFSYRVLPIRDAAQQPLAQPTAGTGRQNRKSKSSASSVKPSGSPSGG